MDSMVLEKVINKDKETESDQLVTIKLSELKRLYKKIHEYQILIETYQTEIAKDLKSMMDFKSE